jgi:RNase H-fold protein (predicted Holliday junction resolvase)
MSDALSTSTSLLLGFDPGRDKCGVALLDSDRAIYCHRVVSATDAISEIQDLCLHYSIELLIMGNQTTAQQWQQRLGEAISIPIELIDERYSTLQARDRYWEMFPPQGFTKLIPRGMREVPRPIDDIVAIILVERYLAQTSSRSRNVIDGKSPL